MNFWYVKSSSRVVVIFECIAFQILKGYVLGPTSVAGVSFQAVTSENQTFNSIFPEKFNV